ncbi:MAG: DHA2 family efflux MFS transporter permease subunit [Thermoleophilia bacterium]|nr:DHA2 family efflux MFS transporter permease subunit [Thermoleophilia bacterium]
MRGRLLGEENRKWWTLAAVAVPLFMVMLDDTVVNVALPTIQKDLGIEVTALEWVVTGYALSFAVLMLSGGKVADMVGRRRVFMAGLVIFTLASLLCGLAGNAELLISARVLQGVGSACMMPASLSIIVATFPPRERGTALGIWAGVSATALAVGPLVGGLITEHIGWNWIFFINVPVGILGLVFARLAIAESKDTSKEQRLDLPGLLTSAIALFGLVFALIEANSRGWTSPLILGLFGLTLVSGTAFVVLELRQRLPMFDMTLLHNPTFVGANTVALLLQLSMFGVFFFISLFMQDVLGYSAVHAGAAFLPMTVLLIFVAPAAGKASDRLGSRWLMVGGMALFTCALLVFAQLQPDSSYLALLPGMVLGGFGIAVTMTPMTAAALGSVPVDKAGVGSGMLNTFRQVGGSLGIAVMGAILANGASAALADGATDVDAFMNGLHHALYAGSLVAFAGAAVALVTIGGHTRSRPGPESIPVAAA